MHLHTQICALNGARVLKLTASACKERSARAPSKARAAVHLRGQVLVNKAILGLAFKPEAPEKGKAVLKFSGCRVWDQGFEAWRPQPPHCSQLVLGESLSGVGACSNGRIYGHPGHGAA